MLKNIYNSLQGSVHIDITGAAIERFLNLCSIHEVRFWDVKCQEPDHFTAWVSAGGYFALRPYARNCGCRIRLLKKRGAPFLYLRFTRRAALWSGLLLSAAVIWILSGMVWTIEVRGCRETTPREILTLMEEAGIRTGARRAQFQMRKLRNDVMLKTDKLSYFTVNFQGTHAIIEVWEKRNYQEKPEEAQPCDIVSDLTGIVEALRVRTGIAQVKVGDTLQPGDVIATGVIVNEHDDTQVTLLHAEAEADVRTWCIRRTIVPSELQLLTQTLVEEKQHGFRLGVRRFPLGLIEKNGFSWYDKQINIQHLKLREDFRWPLGFVTAKILECQAEKAQIDREKLSQVLEARMLARLLLEKPDARVIDTQFALEQTEQGAWQGILKAELVETTGKEVPIG